MKNHYHLKLTPRQIEALLSAIDCYEDALLTSSSEKEDGLIPGTQLSKEAKADLRCLKKVCEEIRRENDKAR